MKPVILRLSIFLCGLHAALAVADVDAQAIALNCLNCHGDGADADFNDAVIPSFEKLSRQQLQQALLAFKYDKKTATLMPRLAKGYSDNELIAVAEYLTRH